MAIRIMFDASNNPEQPTVVLAKRNGDKLGMLNAKEFSVSDSFNDAPELSFKVYKKLDGELCPLWDEITNFKLIYCVEWNTWFEMTVELDESDETIKTVFCTGLGYAELGQIMLYTIEINTEEDIARDDYEEPTVLFNEKNPKASLLNRIMEKAPHYTITHVDASIADIQRTFSFDDTSIYDAFQEIAEEIKCVFILNANSDGEGNLQRTIEVYDLQSYCFDCGHRGDFFDVCPECGSENVKPGYGEDTTIFIAPDDLADNIGFTTDTDAVKNCFKLEGGDDLMTATIRNCNPNGTDYLWYFSDDMKKEMPKELVDKIESYDDLYQYYQNDHVVIPSYTDAVVAYNNLIDKYKVFNEDLERIEIPIKGYPALMNAYYNTIDMNLYLTSSMMPSVETIETDAKKELAKLTSTALSPVAVQKVSIISNATADNVVLSMAKLIVDSRFKVKINSSSISNSGSSCTWTGSFIVTNYYDEEDTATGNNIRVLINDNFEEFVKEKVEKQLAKEGDGEVDIVGLFSMTYNNFVNELRKYSLNRLRSFYASCQACLDVLIEQGVADKESWDGQDPNLYDDLYYPYLQKQNAISSEISVREQEISLIVGDRDSDGDLVTYGLQNYLDIYRDEIQNSLDFEKYLGEDLLLEFAAYRREDKYANDNYISDALSNTELFDKAQEFLERATEEIHKSAEQQHSISSSLKNLLVIDKFKPIVDKFSVGNWLRIIVDDTIYKLRLINYEIDYDDIEDISVEFSDVIRSKDSASDIQSVLDQASSMASSYDSVKHQAEQGKNGNDKLNGWVNEGLSLTNMTIVGDADNQNMQWDSHGMLLREYLPITNTYDDRQLKIINRGLYVTDDNWTTSRAGIGNFRFYNPKAKEYEDAYGVIADTIVGNIVLSEEVGIYNKNNSITMDGDGFHITTSADALKDSDVFTIQKENKLPDGSVSTDKLLYFDNNGNLVINGTVRVYSSGSSTPPADTTLGDVINATTDAIDKVDVEYALGDSPNIAPSTGWSTNSPIWTEGKYIWQRTATTTTSGKTSYSKPVCIQGAAGQDGIPGESAPPVYFHVAYANSADGQTDFSTTDATNKKYMGTYVDDIPADSDDPTKYTWVLIKGEDGADGTPGKNGQDGKTYYLHIAYANNATGTEGFSTTDGTNKKYIGQCVDTNQADPTTPSSYTWSLFKGADGTDGLPGKDGVDGTSTYVHIKYSEYENPTDDQMTEIPNAYIGICTDNNQEDPTTASSYTWSKFEGKDGTDGLPGKDGEDGTSTYVHFAYATSSDGSKGFSTTSFDGALYIGVLTDNTQEDSPRYQDYAWSRMRGEDGTDGIPGKDGEDGTSSFVHIKYSDYPNPTDEQMTETPSTYIGICTDSNQQDPITASSYTWSKFEGKDGNDGLPGTNGKDGTSSFVHFAYSTSSDGSKNFSTTHFEGATHLGVLTNDIQEDSQHYQDYIWSLIKGADGKDGIPGTNGKDGVSSYVHIKYAPVEDPNDDQITETPDAYIGICVDSNQQDPTTASSYTWSKFEGKDGTDGLPGTNGKDGTSTYVHFAYATSSDGSKGFSTTPFDGALYIGVLTDNNTTDSTDYQDYTWSRMRGEDGADGLPGAPGKDGVSTYVHIKYSPVASPSDSQMTETSSTYIGICVDTNREDPTTASSYTWSKFEGKDGAEGAPGKNGTNGTSSFVHFAYANSADGSKDFSVTQFDGATYIGVLTDSNKNDSTDYQDYTWSLIKGNGVEKIEEQYYLSTSNTTQTGGTWSAKQPAWQSGKYIWTRSKVTWSDKLEDGTNKITYTDPVLAQAINDANEGVHEVKSYSVYDNNGLTIGKEGDPTSVRMAAVGEFQVRENDDVLARMSSDGTQILYNGSVVASYGSTTTIGSTSGYNTYISGSGIQLRSGTTALTTLSSSAITIGRTSSSYYNTYINTNGLHIRRGTTQVASYTATEIDLGKNSSSSTMYLADRSIVITGSSDGRTGSFSNSAGSYFGFSSDGFTSDASDSYCIMNSAREGYIGAYGKHGSSLDKHSFDDLLGAVTLYSNSSGSNGRIPLSTGGYGYLFSTIVALDIFFKDDGSTPRYYTQRVYSMGSWNLRTALFYNVFGANTVYTNTCIVSITLNSSGGEINFISGNMGGGWYTSNETNAASASSSPIKIMKVIGYR